MSVKIRNGDCKTCTMTNAVMTTVLYDNDVQSGERGEGGGPGHLPHFFMSEYIQSKR